MNPMQVLRRTQGAPPTKQQIKGWQGIPPQLILVDLSKSCTLWCYRHCGYPGQQLRREQRLKEGLHVEPKFINAELLKKAFDEIIISWPPFKPVIQISADGEPLLHPKREELITYPAEKLGLDVGLTSNGTLLTPQLVERFCNAGLSLINISLDAATPETYQLVRPTRAGANLFHKVTDNIRAGVAVRNKLAKEKPIKTKFMITMIQRVESANEEDAFETLGKDMGVDRVSFRPLNTSAGLTPFAIENSKIIERDKDGVVTTVEGVKRHPCHFPFTRFSLTFEDEQSLQFAFCPHAWDRRDADVGKYPRDGSLKELWRSQVLEDVRKSHLLNKFNPKSICGGCPDWRFVTTREKSTYADIVKNNDFLNQ